MSIVRVNKEDKYFSASNEPFNDDRLLWETRGLIGYLLSKPNHWTIRMDDLLKRGPGGRDKVRKMLKDAQIHGYLNRQRIAKADGTFFWMWDVYESPSLNPTPQTSGGFSVTGKPVTALPVVAKPVTGKPADIVITEEVRTKTGTTRGGDIFRVYEQEIGVLTPMIADALRDAETTYPSDWIKAVIHEAAKNNKRNWKYCEAIVKRWQAQGYMDDGKKPETKAKTKINGGKAALEKYAQELGLEV